MPEGLNQDSGRKNEVLMEIMEIKGKVDVMAKNEAEDRDLLNLLEDVRSGRCTPEEGERRATIIIESKQDWFN